MIKVLAHGCFDVLHAGHLEYLRQAKKFGDHLTVSVTSDRFVNKGPGRPYFNHHVRMEMVKALKLVDEVILSDAPTALGVLAQVRPDFYVKGPDYRDLDKDPTGEIYNEKAAVESYGGRLVFTEQETYSSSNIINKVFQPFSDDQKAMIERAKELGGIQAIEKALDEIAKLSILVCGEPIIDEYRFVRPEGISSKSPTISARHLYSEEYNGGSLAIAAHLLGFTEKVCLHVPTFPPPRKVRYISGNQRVFEVTHIDEDIWQKQDPKPFCDQLIARGNQSDLVLIADFGHGLFDGPALEALDKVESFIALNVQANSSNFGFNVYTKHKNFDYLCIDKREAQLALHNNKSDPYFLSQRIAGDTGRLVGVTLGPNGAKLISRPFGIDCWSPAFADQVVDAIGAGDAYLAITSALLRTDCDPELIPFIGCVFAGLKTKIIGNKSAVSKASLIKAIKGILS